MIDHSVCPICSADRTEILYQELYDDRYGYPGKFRLRSCLLCDHRFLENQFKNEDFTELYTKYYPRSQQTVEGFKAHELMHGFAGWVLGEKSAAFTWVPEKVHVLDVGCGFGQSVAYHAARGSKAVGVDADANAKRVADHYGLDIRIGVFHPEMFKNEKFEYITLDQVLEHSQNPIQFLSDVKSLLAVNGKIVMAIPNAFGIGPKLFGKRWIHWHTPYHLQFFSRRSLEKLIRQVGGLEIVRETSITHSHWIFYQMLALLTYPKMGEKSAFWGSGAFSFGQKVARKILGLCLKLGVFSVYSRIVDSLKLGDNKVIILQASSLDRTKY